MTASAMKLHTLVHTENNPASIANRATLLPSHRVFR
jgi:hypothetical protein